MSAALYICYFGLREPLVQTQVLPYLREERIVLVKGNGTQALSVRYRTAHGRDLRL